MDISDCDPMHSFSNGGSMVYDKSEPLELSPDMMMYFDENVLANIVSCQKSLNITVLPWIVVWKIPYKCTSVRNLSGSTNVEMVFITLTSIFTITLKLTPPIPLTHSYTFLNNTKPSIYSRGHNFLSTVRANK